MMISYQELVRTFPYLQCQMLQRFSLLRTQRCIQQKQYDSASHFLACFSLNWNVDSSLGNYYMILNDITPHLMTTSELCMFSMGSLT